MEMSIDNIESLWTDIESGLKDILAGKSMTKQRFSQLYNKIYTSCTDLDSTKTVVEKSESSDPRVKLTYEGKMVYDLIERYLTNYLNNVLNDMFTIDDDEIIEYYIEQWKSYCEASKNIDRVFYYLNRYYIPRRIDEGCTDTFFISVLTNLIWFNVVFAKIEDKLIGSMINIISIDRNGADHKYKKNMTPIISCIFDLSKIMPFSKNSPLYLYQTYFEDRYIEISKNYYKNESETRLLRLTCAEYVAWSDAIIKSERYRCRNYISSTSEDVVLFAICKVLVLEHIDIYKSDFTRLLHQQNSNIDDLSILYNILTLVPSSIKTFANILEDEMCLVGNENYEDWLTKTTEKEPILPINTPIIFVTTFLRVYVYFENILKKCLQNNQILKSSFDRAARKFLNKNAITEYQLDHSKYDPNKSSEYLSRYIDIILQQSNKVKTGVITEEDIDPIMIVFKFLESRDVFQEYICRSLSKRLCRSELILDDGELLFIQKLKEVCGAEYTNKLKQLFEDWKTSKSYTQGKFKEYMQSQKSSGPEMNINVFRSSIWPYATNNVLIAPNEMKPYIRHFEKFYSDMYTNRKLNWINSHGRAEIVTHGFSKQFVFVVSSIEATVLLLFNNAELYTFQRIKKKVPVPEATLAQIMHIFVMSRLVVQIPASTGSRTEQIESINDATVFKIYNDYNNKKLRINLNVPIKNELKTDNNNINRHIDEDRKTLLQAIIVKFVKTNKVCSLADIVNESKRATIGHFQITDFYIKKVIDGLVDKEYLTRDEPNKEIYHYVA